MIVLLIRLIFNISIPISAFSSNNISSLNQNDPFYKDLTFIQKTLIENHPGVFNELDPTFVIDMNTNFELAKQKLLQVTTDEEKMEIIQEFGKSFNDAHLGIYYNYKKKEIKPFSIQDLTEKICWIEIPTFQPPLQDQVIALNQIIESLKLPSRKEQTIVFDLRGNSGGNSAWGIDILKALFGKDYVLHHLIELYHNTYVKYLASQGNLEYLKDYLCRFKNEFKENHPCLLELTKNIEKIKKAIESKEKYTEQIPYFNPTSFSDSLNKETSFNGRIIAIIDCSNISACLIFLEELKSMTDNVTFIGKTTAADTMYSEIRRIYLPSKKGFFVFPMFIKFNRRRGNNEPIQPDIFYYDNLQDTMKLQNHVIRYLSR
jgi:hypothetical protein